MVQKASVVTPERFSQGFTFKDYLAQIKVNNERFQKEYDTFTLTEKEKRDLRALAAKAGGPAKCLVLGEDWCPDVYRGLPIVARITEAAGIELRVFPRDQNLDIMQEFLNQGQYQSIPTVVFYTKDHRYLGHWIERPQLANRELAQIREYIAKEMAGKPEEEIRAERRRRTEANWETWKRETVREITELLRATVK